MLSISRRAYHTRVRFIRVTTHALCALRISIDGIVAAERTTRQVRRTMGRTRCPSKDLIGFMLANRIRISTRVGYRCLRGLFSSCFCFRGIGSQAALQISCDSCRGSTSLGKRFVHVMLKSRLSRRRGTRIVHYKVLTLSKRRV